MLSNPRSVAAPKAVTAQQRFRANVERFQQDLTERFRRDDLPEWCQFYKALCQFEEQLKPDQYFDGLLDQMDQYFNGIFQLLGTDQRMQRVWKLLADQPDRQFDEFLDNVLDAWTRALRSFYQPRLYKLVLKHIAKIHEVTQTLQGLRETAVACLRFVVTNKMFGMTTPLVEASISATVPKWEDMFASLESFEAHFKGCELEVANEVNEANRTLSRKAESSPHTEFARKMVPVMMALFGNKHYAIIADLVSVLYVVDISADAVRKA
jgi:hypothetical protein